MLAQNITQDLREAWIHLYEHALKSKPGASKGKSNLVWI